MCLTALRSVIGSLSARDEQIDRPDEEDSTREVPLTDEHQIMNDPRGLSARSIEATIHEATPRYP